MFWNKPPKKIDKSVLPSEETIAQVEEKPRSGSEQFDDATEVLARALREFSTAAAHAASEAAQSERDLDLELQVARKTVEAGEVLVRDGGLEGALFKLADHIEYWPSWIEHEDFEKHLGFAASNISAKSEKHYDGYKKSTVMKVDFTFNNSRYRVIEVDEGETPYPEGEGSVLLGDIELQAKSECLLSLYRSGGLKALKTGPWMQDLLDIAAQIKTHDDNFFQRFHDNKAKELYKNIHLS